MAHTVYTSYKLHGSSAHMHRGGKALPPYAWPAWPWYVRLDVQLANSYTLITKTCSYNKQLHTANSKV